MDSKGYIPISLLASFNRIKQLTLDTRLVKEVLMLSAFVEVNGGMVRMGGAAAAAAAAAATSNSNPSSGGLNEGGGQQNRMSNSSSWESFVLPDAVESVVEDVVVENVTDNGYGGYHHHHQQHQQQQQQQQQLNGYGYGGSTGYGYGYGAAAAGYGYGYGYGYPPVGPTAGLGYYEDLQSQQQQQQHPQHASGYETGEGVVDDQRQQQQQQQHEEHVSSHIDHGETVLPSMLMNGHTAESTTAMTSKLDDPPHHPTSVIKEEEITGKLNGIFKRDQHQQCGDGRGEGCDGEEEEEEEEEEEDVVFVMGGTDVSTSWTPERERRA